MILTGGLIRRTCQHVPPLMDQGGETLSWNDGGRDLDFEDLLDFFHCYNCDLCCAARIPNKLGKRENL